MVFSWHTVSWHAYPMPILCTISLPFDAEKLLVKGFDPLKKKESSFWQIYHHPLAKLFIDLYTF